MRRDTVTDRHKGQRFIIGGTSPYLMQIDSELFKTGIVIGVNQFITWYDCHYWLTCDPQNIGTRMGITGHLVDAYKVETFSSKAIYGRAASCHIDHEFDRPIGTKLNEHRQPVGEYTIPAQWCGRLQHIWTSATAAMNLAKIMGAREIILAGVDITGPTRRGDTVVDWAVMAPDIDEFIKKLNIRVLKTNPRSPLKVPLLI